MTEPICHPLESLLGQSGDTMFLLLIACEGINENELLLFGKGSMENCSTTAQTLVEASLIPATGWFVTCGECHPEETREWAERQGHTIVIDEFKTRLILDGLLHHIMKGTSLTTKDFEDIAGEL